MSLYSSIAEKLQYISPSFYKERFFKKLKNLSAENILERKIEPELFWIAKYLKKDDVFLDVGANVGAYIFQAEKAVNPTNIYAFEPNHQLYKRLKRIFAEVNVIPFALSDEDGETTFKVPIINGKKVHTRGTLEIGMKEKQEQKAILETVKTIKLDKWTELQKPDKISFIKMDVEGSEIHTVKGAEKTIRKYRPVMMIEIEQRHHHNPVWNFIEEIENFGYRAHYLNRETLQPEILTRDFFETQNAENVKNYEQYINNIIFIPKG